MTLSKIPSFDTAAVFGGIYFIAYEAEQGDHGIYLQNFIEGMPKMAKRISEATLGSEVVKLINRRVPMFAKHMIENEVEQYRLVVKIPENLVSVDVINAIHAIVLESDYDKKLRFLQGDYGSWSVVKGIDDEELYTVEQ